MTLKQAQNEHNLQYKYKHRDYKYCYTCPVSIYLHNKYGKLIFNTLRNLDFKTCNIDKILEIIFNLFEPLDQQYWDDSWGYKYIIGELCEKLFYYHDSDRTLYVTDPDVCRSTLIKSGDELDRLGCDFWKLTDKTIQVYQVKHSGGKIINGIDNWTSETKQAIINGFKTILGGAFNHITIWQVNVNPFPNYGRRHKRFNNIYEHCEILYPSRYDIKVEKEE